MTGSAFCISIDVERAWGIWDKPSEQYFRRCLEHEANILTALVQLFETYEISATWAVVGRLLEPAADQKGDPALWHAPECVGAICAGRQPQEIASHSYAHPYYGQIDRESAARDLGAARRVHERNGLSFASFVFPRNDVSHLDVLAEHGIRVFRSVDQGFHTTLRRRGGRTIGRVANLVDKMLPIPPQAVRPIQHANGLVELPSSMLLMARNGLRRAVHPRAIELKAALGLAAAVQSDGLFHLWFHPSNFYYRMEAQLGILEGILQRARVLRERGSLAVRTMGSYAA